jgi:trimeric autotransporter adhesin
MRGKEMFGQNSRWLCLPIVFISLLALGFSDTAQAQTVTLTVNGTALTQPMTFTVPAGAVSQPQVIHVTTPPNNGNTVTVQVPPASSWIQVAPTVIPNTPDNLSVSVNASSLTAGSHSGSFTVMISGNANSAVTVNVNATVTGTSALSATPISLSFVGQANAATGTPQNCAVQNSSSTCQITILTNGPQLGYNIIPTTTDGFQWIRVDAFSGTTNGSPFNVGINPSMVPGPGTYSGQILVQSTTTSDAVAISITMVVSNNATLTAVPSHVSFFYTTGTAVPAAQQVTVNSNGGLVSFNVSQTPNTSWLHVTPISSAANTNSPATLQISVTPGSPVVLIPNTYTATITIVPNNGGPSPTISVSLAVSSNPFLTASTAPGNQLTFSAPFGGPPPSVQPITLGSSGTTPISFTAAATSDRGWLSVLPTAGNTTTAPTIQVGVLSNVLNTLAVGTYSGTVTIAPSNGDQYTIVVAVTLTVGATSQLTAAPQSLVFSFQTNLSPPQAQTVILAAAGPPVGFTITTSASNTTSCGTANWLSAIAQQSPLSTPNVLTVSVNTTGMTAGTCNGTVRIQYSNIQGNTELDIPVTLFVSNAALIDISLPQGFGLETARLGSTVTITRNITLTSTDGTTGLQYQISAQSSPCAWLFAAPSTGGSTGTTPAPAQVQISPSCIGTPGPYQGSVTITSASGLPQPVTFNITLNVTSIVSVAVTPQALTFNQAQGASAPAAQNLKFIVSGGDANFIATVATDFGGTWLTVTPASGSTSLGTIQVTAASSTLPANTYTGQITLTFQNAETPSATIPVRLIIGPAQTLTASPTSLAFNYVLGGTAPATQQFTLTSTGGSVNFTIGTTSSGGWLGVDTNTGSTGSTSSKVVTVTIDPTKIPAGSQVNSPLQGSLSIAAPGVLASPIVVSVTLTVTPAPIPMPTTISTSAINNGFGSIAPGELIAIKGTNLGPLSPAGGTSFTVNTQGGVDSTLAGVQVLFDSIPGTPTFVSPTQINVIVPWEIAGRSSTNMTVIVNGGPSAIVPLTVVTVAPGIYTQNATGAGQIAAVNLSPTSPSPYNGPAGGVYPGTSAPTVPAAPGSYVAIFLTGGGLTSPGSADGSVNPPVALPLRNWTFGSNVVTATIGGLPVTVQYAGAAPTLITGVVQVNLQVPLGVTGNLPVVITIDGVQTPQPTATIAVQ